MLQIENISYQYGKQQILTDISYTFETGKMYAIVGESGSGKTTLLSLMCGIDKAPKGKVIYNGKEITALSATKYRRQISIVFQAYNLIYYMSALQNVITALDIVGIKGNHREIAQEYLRKVGIDDTTMKRGCGRLSGGQQQRVAIARALACNSDIIFADEPTGNLDSKTGKEIITLLKSLAVEENKCVICVTHDKKLAGFANAVIEIEDGVMKGEKNS